MDLSGIIFVALAVAWAGFLIPKALKRHDEVVRTRAIDRFSTAMRVLARREPISRRDARLVITSVRPVTIPAPPQPTPVRSQARRTAAREAGRRRRHILLALLLITAVVSGLAGFTYVPWWAVAIPSTCVVVYLVLCRTQVRREDDASWSRDVPAPHREDEDLAPHRAIRVEARVRRTQNEQGFDEVSPDEDTVALSVAALQHALQVDAVAVSVETVDGGSLWDPLPVTLPTYVEKSRAPRTVRTIDLNATDTWSSGRSAADTKLVAEAAAEAADVAEKAEQRAVGS